LLAFLPLLLALAALRGAERTASLGSLASPSAADGGASPPTSSASPTTPSTPAFASAAVSFAPAAGALAAVGVGVRASGSERTLGLAARSVDGRTVRGTGPALAALEDSLR